MQLNIIDAFMPLIVLIVIHIILWALLKYLFRLQKDDEAYWQRKLARQEKYFAELEKKYGQQETQNTQNTSEEVPHA